jgi:2-polyprenyl-6-methoxyphenol hydroxylase-like FAD-dependent oxidoreductase
VISGAHAIVYSKDPDKDRDFLREILRLPNIDVGGGWLIFGLPPSEVAVHPAEQNGRHELYFLAAARSASTSRCTRGLPQRDLRRSGRRVRRRRRSRELRSRVRARRGNATRSSLPTSRAERMWKNHLCMIGGAATTRVSRSEKRRCTCFRRPQSG